MQAYQLLPASRLLMIIALLSPVIVELKLSAVAMSQLRYVVLLCYGVARNLLYVSAVYPYI